MSKERFEAWADENLTTGDDRVSARRAWQASKADSLQEIKGLVEAVEKEANMMALCELMKKPYDTVKGRARLDQALSAIEAVCSDE